MNRPLKIFLYVSFSVIAVLFFLYYRFPSDAVRDRITEAVTAYHPDIQLTTQHVTPVFPPGMKLEPVYVSYKDQMLLSAQSLKIAPHLFSLIREQKSASFYALMGNGECKGQVTIDDNEKRPQTTITVNLKTVSIDALDFLKQWPSFHPSGDLTAYIDYDSRKGAGGSAKINMEVTPAKIVFDPPLMGLEQLEFSQIQTEATVTPRMLQIRSCEAGGPHLEVKISGSIIFRQPFENSRVTMSCTLKPQPAFIAEHKSDMVGGLLGSDNAQKRGVIVRIAGTIGNPTYTVR